MWCHYFQSVSSLMANWSFTIRINSSNSITNYTMLFAPNHFNWAHSPFWRSGIQVEWKLSAFLGNFETTREGMIKYSCCLALKIGSMCSNSASKGKYSNPMWTFNSQYYGLMERATEYLKYWHTVRNCQIIDSKS